MQSCTSNLKTLRRRRKLEVRNKEIPRDELEPDHEQLPGAQMQKKLAGDETKPEMEGFLGWGQPGPGWGPRRDPATGSVAVDASNTSVSNSCKEVNNPDVEFRSIQKRSASSNNLNGNKPPVMAEETDECNASHGH